MDLLLQAATWAEWIAEMSRLITDSVWSSIDSLVRSLFARLPFVAAGLIVLIIFILFSRLIKAAVLAAMRRTRLDRRLRILISRFIAVVTIVLGIFSALTVIIPSFAFGDLIAGLGFTSFVVGFATKDILNNFLSGILILWQQPFHIGDDIFIGTNQGKVEYIGVRATSLRKDDGELVLIPNGDMYSQAITIRGAGKKRRMNLGFSVGFDTDMDVARNAARAGLARTAGVEDEPAASVYVSDLANGGVEIKVRYWINTNESSPLDVFDRAAVAVLEELRKVKIKVYPPSTMIVDNPQKAAAEKRKDI